MSFRIKTILLFLAIGLAPYAITMFLMGNSFRQEQHAIVTQELKTELHLTIEKIDHNLNTLKKDMLFMSRSDMMNDIYTDDLDRRIANLLLAKKNDITLHGDFYVIGKENIIIASSDFSKIGLPLNIKPLISIPIISNVTQQEIGILTVEYHISNLASFFSNTSYRQYYVKDSNSSVLLRIAKFDHPIQISQKLKSNPKWTIVIEEEKNYAHRLLHKFELLFGLLLIAGAVFISFLSYYVATVLIRPIIALSDIANSITNTQNYTQQVTLERNDEIGQLADSFNTMIRGIDNALHEITDLNKEIEATQREVVFTMGSIAESRSKETGNHVKRVSEYSKLLALYYGLNKEETELLKQASPMHDIGKIAIPDAILNKPGKFDDSERKIMNTHAELGNEMLKHSNRPLLKAAAIVAHEHHEKWDGTGYPRKLSGEEIHIYGRITALADVFDALGSDRIYKKAWEDDKIFAFFKEERGKHFDPALIDIFFEHLPEFLTIRESFKDQVY